MSKRGTSGVDFGGIHRAPAIMPYAGITIPQGLNLYSLHCFVMSTTTFSVPNDYHYVVAALSSIPLFLWGQFFTVEVYRRKAKIAYPQLYADKAEVEASRDAYIFNCAQRAHQNTLETIPVILLGTAISGLQYPLSAASFCAFWSITRIPFTLGYISGEPSKRAQGGAKFAIWGSIILSLVSAFVAGKRLLEYKAVNDNVIRILL